MESPSHCWRGSKRSLSLSTSKNQTSALFTDGLQQDIKRRRLDLARKELFNSTKRTSPSIQRKGITMQEKVSMDVDEEPSTMSSKKYYALRDRTNSISNSPYTKTQIAYTILGTPTKNPPRIIDPSHTKDFLQLEMMCETNETVPSISVLMDSKMASPAKMKKTVNNMLVGIVNEMEEEFMELECAQKNYVEKMYDVTELRNNVFAKLKNNVDLLSSSFRLPNRDKENLQHVNTEVKDGLLPMKKGGKLLLSPVILRGGDLRKSTLRKNFNAQNISTPKRGMC